MQELNTIILVGAVAKYVNVLEDPNGNPISEITVAGSQEVTGSDGKPHTLTWYHRCFLPEIDPALVARAYLKGQVVKVSGSVHAFTDVRDNKARTEMVVKVSWIEEQEASPDWLLLDKYGNPRLKDATNMVGVLATLPLKPEVKTAVNGNPYCFFPVHMYSSSLYEWEGPSTVFQELQVVCWGETAQAMANFDFAERIVVIGTLENGIWPGPEGGQFKKPRITAEKVLQGEAIDALLEHMEKAAAEAEASPVESTDAVSAVGGNDS